jgi:ubiquinone/menaquinone biosynthesis C-methylase UbiE
VSQNTLPAADIITALKAAAEPTRLRILMLLAAGEYNVKDLTEILGQSQPRVSRHLKLLNEAGLVEKFREGSWAYFHVSDRTEGGRLTLRLLATVDPNDPAIVRDRDRAEASRQERESVAQDFFQKNASDWDRIRALYVPESEVEAEMQRALARGHFKLLADLGTGTGRILELFSARYDRAVGLDVNQAMLAYARTKLQSAGLARAQVRHGDLYNLPLADGAADAVIMHQVLHFLADPQKAIREAARVLAPGGRLLIVDFAPHDLEFLREKYAHERLGFSDSQMQQWLKDAGLTARAVKHMSGDKSKSDPQLTVSLWTADRPTTSASAEKKMLQETE